MVIPYILSEGFEPWILDFTLERECCTRSYIWHSIGGFINSLTAIDLRERQLFYELRWRVFTCQIFIRSQS